MAGLPTQSAPQFLNGPGHYEVYGELAFSQVMKHTLDWYRQYLSA